MFATPWVNGQMAVFDAGPLHGQGHRTFNMQLWLMQAVRRLSSRNINGIWPKPF